MSQFPPNFADRLLAQVYDEKARNTPQDIFAKVPVSTTTYAEGFRTVNYRHIANAVNHVATIIDRRWGKSSNFECMAYIGPADISYVVVLLACIKTGYKVGLFPF